jgi:hypothetical protein
MFESIPVVLKNSHLVNALMCELSDNTKRDHKFNYLDLGTRSVPVFLSSYSATHGIYLHTCTSKVINSFMYGYVDCKMVSVLSTALSWRKICVS